MWSCPLVGVEEHEARRRSPRRRPGRASSRGTPPTCRTGRRAGHDAVERVGEDERRDDQGAHEELAARVEHQGAEADPERADDRDDVRADPEPEQHRGHRGQQLGEEGARVSVQHGGSSVVRPCECRAVTALRAARLCGTPNRRNARRHERDDDPGPHRLAARRASATSSSSVRAGRVSPGCSTTSSTPCRGSGRRGQTEPDDRAAGRDALGRVGGGHPPRRPGQPRLRRGREGGAEGGGCRPLRRLGGRRRRRAEPGAVARVRRSSGCRARSSSPSSTPATPTSRRPWPTARPTSAPASSRSACRFPVRRAVTSIADLLLGEVHDYAGGTRTVRRPGPSTPSSSTPTGPRSSRGSSRSPRTVA